MIKILRLKVQCHYSTSFRNQLFIFEKFRIPKGLDNDFVDIDSFDETYPMKDILT